MSACVHLRVRWIKLLFSFLCMGFEGMLFTFRKHTSSFIVCFWSSAASSLIGVILGYGIFLPPAPFFCACFRFFNPACYELATNTLSQHICCSCPPRFYRIGRNMVLGGTLAVAAASVSQNILWMEISQNTFLIFPIMYKCFISAVGL